MTLKEKVASKLSETQAVSPVIGVILMVAITVILAAVIGTFVMGLGNSVNKNTQAGILFDQVDSSNVDVQLTSLGNVQNASNFSIKGCDGDKTPFEEVGDVATISNCIGSGDKITVVAEINGNENVVATYKLG